MDVKQFLIEKCDGKELFRSVQVDSIIINNFYIQSPQLLITYLAHLSFRSPNLKRSARIKAGKILILFLEEIN